MGDAESDSDDSIASGEEVDASLFHNVDDYKLNLQVDGQDQKLLKVVFEELLALEKNVLPDLKSMGYIRDVKDPIDFPMILSYCLRKTGYVAFLKKAFDTDDAVLVTDFIIVHLQMISYSVSATALFRELESDSVQFAKEFKGKMDLKIYQSLVNKLARRQDSKLDFSVFDDDIDDDDYDAGEQELKASAIYYRDTKIGQVMSDANRAFASMIIHPDRKSFVFDCDDDVETDMTQKVTKEIGVLVTLIKQFGKQGVRVDRLVTLTGICVSSSLHYKGQEKGYVPVIKRLMEDALYVLKQNGFISSSGMPFVVQKPVEIFVTLDRGYGNVKVMQLFSECGIFAVTTAKRGADNPFTYGKSIKEGDSRTLLQDGAPVSHWKKMEFTNVKNSKFKILYVLGKANGNGSFVIMMTNSDDLGPGKLDSKSKKQDYTFIVKKRANAISTTTSTSSLSTANSTATSVNVAPALANAAVAGIANLSIESDYVIESKSLNELLVKCKLLQLSEFQVEKFWTEFRRFHYNSSTMNTFWRKLELLIRHPRHGIPPVVVAAARNVINSIGNSKSETCPFLEKIPLSQQRNKEFIRGKLLLKEIKESISYFGLGSVQTKDLGIEKLVNFLGANVESLSSNLLGIAISQWFVKPVKGTVESFVIGHDGEEKMRPLLPAYLKRFGINIQDPIIVGSVESGRRKLLATSPDGLLFTEAGIPLLWEHKTFSAESRIEEENVLASKCEFKQIVLGGNNTAVDSLLTWVGVSQYAYQILHHIATTGLDVIFTTAASFNGELKFIRCLHIHATKATIDAYYTVFSWHENAHLSWIHDTSVAIPEFPDNTKYYHVSRQGIIQALVQFRYIRKLVVENKKPFPASRKLYESVLSWYNITKGKVDAYSRERANFGLGVVRNEAVSKLYSRQMESIIISSANVYRSLMIQRDISNKRPNSYEGFQHMKQSIGGSTRELVRRAASKMDPIALGLTSANAAETLQLALATATPPSLVCHSSDPYTEEQVTSSLQDLAARLGSGIRGKTILQIFKADETLNYLRTNIRPGRLHRPCFSIGKKLRFNCALCSKREVKSFCQTCGISLCLEPNESGFDCYFIFHNLIVLRHWSDMSDSEKYNVSPLLLDSTLKPEIGTMALPSRVSQNDSVIRNLDKDLENNDNPSPGPTATALITSPVHSKNSKSRRNLDTAERIKSDGKKHKKKKT